MNHNRQRVVAALTSTALGLVVVAWIWSEREVGATVRLVDVRSAIEQDFADRAAQAPDSMSTVASAGPHSGVESTGSPPPVPPILVGRHNYAEVTEELARKMFSNIVRVNPRSMYDPMTFYRGKPGFRMTSPGREHPGGDYLMVNNSLGFRRETELLPTKPDLRVLVTGDSHTEGVVPMAEHFTELTEEQLRANRASRSVEVLNGGVGGYAFFHYLGVVRRFQSLDPDVVVVAVYGGNDFTGSLRLYRYFNRMPLDPGLPKEVRKPSVQIMHESSPLFAQAFDQALRLHYQPESRRLAGLAADEFVEDLHGMCLQQGAKLVLMYIPSLFEVQPQYAERMIRASLDLMGLKYEDLHETTDLADALLRKARDMSVLAIDLRDAYRASTEPLYWAHDHHINTLGHALAARELTKVLEALPDEQ